MLARYIIDLEDIDPEDLVVVSELGFAKKARSFAEKLDAPLAIVEKRRTGNDDQAELKNVIGEVEGKTAVIIDDEINTAGSLIETVNALIGDGAREVCSCATHGVFSGAAIERIEASHSRRSSSPTRFRSPRAWSQADRHPVRRAAVRRGHSAHPPRRERRGPSSRPRSSWSRR